jgi:hypothetical protein
MGGFNSGRRFHWDRQRALDELPAIDIRDWARRGLLETGMLRPYLWASGEARLEVWADIEKGGARLSYRLNNFGPWHDIDEPVLLTSTPVYLGGSRDWFTCPGCLLRAAKLYWRWKRFHCGKCSALRYSTQQASEVRRAALKVHKLRARLGGSVEEWFGLRALKKPKGMHWRTFNRLTDELAKRDTAALGALALHLTGLKSWARSGVGDGRQRKA